MTYVLGLAENSIQLVPDGTLLLHIVIILVMVFVLNATLFKPINRILAARDQRTRGRLSEAQHILKDVSDKVTNYERQLRQARAEAYALTEKERTAALQDRQKKVHEMRQQLAVSLAQEKEVIQRQVGEARETLKVESQRIAGEISARVLDRPVGQADLN
ncbi:MAG: ATP synthase F0 subunit B [Pyrinomonadaceae bacterium]